MKFNKDKFVCESVFAYASTDFFASVKKGVKYMLQINGLNLTHKKDLRVILDKFDLVLNYGDKAAIIGEEGNGKSTLMKWIYDSELVEDYIEATGTRILGNERLGFLPQELLKPPTFALLLTVLPVHK